MKTEFPEKSKSDADRIEYQHRLELFVLNHLEEVTNQIGGVIGYKLSLNVEQTEALIRELQRP